MSAAEYMYTKLGEPQDPVVWVLLELAVREYQNANQNTYQPRPPQTPAPRFKHLYPN